VQLRAQAAICQIADSLFRQIEDLTSGKTRRAIPNYHECSKTSQIYALNVRVDWKSLQEVIIKIYQLPMEIVVLLHARLW